MDRNMRSRLGRYITKGGIGIGVLIALLVVGWLVFGNNSQGVPQVVLDAKQSSPFPLFYPHPMPAGYKMADDSFKQNDTAVLFNVTDGKDYTVIITEQQKPTNTEELKQTRQFSTSVGKAYLADLNGRLAGVIMAGDTLIIASPTGNSDADKLQALLTSFVRL